MKMFLIKEDEVKLVFTGSLDYQRFVFAIDELYKDHEDNSFIKGELDKYLKNGEAIFNTSLTLKNIDTANFRSDLINVFLNGILKLTNDNQNLKVEPSLAIAIYHKFIKDLKRSYIKVNK